MSTLRTSHDLVGAGWAYPARVASNGGVELSTGTAELDGAIRCILETRVGERVMRPEFGSRLSEYVFEPINSRTLGLVQEAAREAILRWEPRIVLESVAAAPGDQAGQVLLTIEYSVRSTNDRRNLVYPFYTIPKETVR